MDASILVHIAAIFYIAGLLVVDQLLLRSLILIGTVLYLFYYALAVSPPLWSAFFWTAIMGVANCYIMLKLILDRTIFGLNNEQRELYNQVFNEMSPGEFRQLLSSCTWHTGATQPTLTNEGKNVDGLFYVLQGGINIRKRGQEFQLNKGSFIGEVAFFLKSAASATVTVEPTTRYIKWEGDVLRKLQQKSPGIRAALHSILNHDMAAKVARSMGDSAIA